MDNKLWCEWQIIDKEGKVLCTAHLAEARAFPCPYKNNKEQKDAEYPCSDYRERGGK